VNTIVLYDDSVDIPAGIRDLAGFRRWVHSDDFPEQNGYLELDGTPEMVLEIVSASSVEKDKETPVRFGGCAALSPPVFRR
jgi:hypothetical protein